jgi:hypothetical protein
MSITSTQAPKTLTIRFTSGVCVNGIDYGPDHWDMPVTLPGTQALGFIARGKARIEPPPAPAPEPADLPPGATTEPVDYEPPANEPEMVDEEVPANEPEGVSTDAAAEADPVLGSAPSGRAGAKPKQGAGRRQQR